MAASTQEPSGASKSVSEDPKEGADKPSKEEKPATALEEDDEFEDFPVEGRSRHSPTHIRIRKSKRRTDLTDCTDWTEEDAQAQGGSTHLWEESWDDDDTSEDFSAQLK